MNRPIKFRAWIDDIGFINEADIYIAQNGKVFAGDLDNPPITDVTDRVKILQYTGLYDNNGKEIYEGDIIRWEDGQIQKVEYGWMEVDAFEVYGCNIWTFLGSCSSNYNLGSRVQSEIEVIGNIYENPELLTQKEG